MESIVNQTLDNWQEIFSKKDWEQIINDREQEVCMAFRSAISIFSDLLKKKLLEDLPEQSTNSKCIEAINYLASSVGRMILELPADMNSVDEVKSSSDCEEAPKIFIHAPEDVPMLPLILSKSEDVQVSLEEEIESTLFNRVLSIFTNNKQGISELFNDIDINKDGKLTKNELRAFFRKYDKTITEEETSEVFELLDGNHDGMITVEIFTKRFKFITQKARLELKDPLACIVISNPLDSEKINGTISVLLKSAQFSKPGNRVLKVRIKDFLEYTTKEITEQAPSLNFICDFLMENKTVSNLPTVIEVDVLRKGVIEGSCKFNWQIGMSCPTDFRHKLKIDLKTSLGQSRGSLQIIIHWNTIIPKIFTDQELQHLQKLAERAKVHKQEFEEKERILKRRSLNELSLDINQSDDFEEQTFEGSEEIQHSPKTETFIMQISKKCVETIFSKRMSIPSPLSSPKNNLLRAQNKSKTLVESRPKTPMAYLTASPDFSPSPKGTPVKHTKKFSNLNLSFN